MPLPPLPKHPKIRGELAETIFVSAAMRHGFRVSKPYGDSGPYDFIVERAGRMSRVQVKATACCERKPGFGYWLHTCYRPDPSRPSRLYRSRDIDFIACYIFRHDEWYIIPIRRIHSSAVRLHRRDPRAQFEQYCEAWDLLAGSADEIDAAASGQVPHLPKSGRCVAPPSCGECQK